MQNLCKEKEKDRGRWFLFLLGCLLSINTMVAQSDVKSKNITYQCKNEQLSKALRQVERLSAPARANESLPCEASRALERLCHAISKRTGRISRNG